MTQAHRRYRIGVLLGLSAGILSGVHATAGEQNRTGSEDSPAPTTAPAGQVIEGIVVNHLGAGLQGAIVRIEALDASEDDPPLAMTRAGETGEIHIQLPRRIEATVRARVTHDGYTTFLQEIDLTNEEEPPWIDAVMEGAATLKGVVRDRLFNEPVKGAQVICESAGQDFQAITDSAGRYQFNTIAHGPVSLMVTARGFGVKRMMIHVRENQAEADIELGPERKVELTIVTDQEQPAADVRVEGYAQPGNEYVNATTGPDGKVSLHGINEEAETILLRLNGPRFVQMRGFEVQVLLPPGEENESGLPTSMPAVHQELMVQVAGRIKGRVTDAKTGDPIVGVRVVVGHEFRSDAPMAWTALDGTYELTGVAPGDNLLSFQHREYATAFQEIHIEPEKVVTADAKMDPGQALGGKVVGSDGKPIAKVFVTGDVWEDYTTLGLRAITDEEGTFLFNNAPAGEVLFSFVKPGYGRPLQRALASGKTDHLITLDVLPPDLVDAPPIPPPARLEVGKVVPDMTLVGLDGTTYMLADMRGKYVFLDMWATWCQPCMAEIENIKALRASMKERADFVLIGISLDTDRDALKQAISKHGIDWPQVFGPKSGAREAFETFNGTAIPYTCLISPDGKLLAQNLQGAGLVEAVKAAMQKPTTTKPGE